MCRTQALAFTSKRPGKTQQFNYFMMNNNTENAFYLVDMPGMGYAKVTHGNPGIGWISGMAWGGMGWNGTGTPVHATRQTKRLAALGGWSVSH